MNGLTDEKIGILTKHAYEVGAAPSVVGERLAQIVEAQRPKARRRLALRPMMLAAGLVVVVAAGAAIRVWSMARNEAGFSDASGRMWRIPSVHGSIRFSDLKGRTMAMVSAGGTDASEPTEVFVGRERFLLRGVGRHELRGKDGAIYGYALVRPVEDSGSAKGQTLESLLAEREAALKTSMGSGVQGGIAVAMGHDATSGVFWKVAGEAKVSGRWPNGEAFASEARPFDPLQLERVGLSVGAFSLPKEPKLAWTAGGTSGSAEGYGTWAIHDAKGKAVMSIKVEPLLDRLP